MTTNKLNTEQYVGWHDDEKCAFHLKLGDKTVTDIAVLEYRWVRDGVADLFHTEVPTAYRGKGIAKILAQTALDYMVQQDAKIILSCSYLSKYVQDNPLPKYIERVLDES
ncbi:Protein NATD1 [Lamellibrachia satsuma]|nr:Protein NATD1 [Lamellibrachia satsuma]